jgi:hypothetical protein
MADGKKKKIYNVAIEADLVPYISFSAGLKGMSATAYFNHIIRQERDSMPADRAKLYEGYEEQFEG